jgi:hypothetical protein
MTVPAAAAGKKGKCPKCGHVLVVPDPAATRLEPAETEPAPEAAAPPESAAAEETSDSRSLLDDLASQEQAADVIAGASAPAEAGRQPCPACGVMMPPAATLCVSCGYNAQTGRRQKVTRTEPPAILRVLSVFGAFGPFIRGCIFSTIGAIIGGVLWWVIAMKTGYEVGYVAWIVGALAGTGMHIGFRDESVVAGIVAAGLSVASIVTARVVIFFFVIAAMFGSLAGDAGGGKTSRSGKSSGLAASVETDVKRMRIAAHRAERLAMRKGLAPGADEREKLFDQEHEKCKAMTTAELDKAIQGIEAWEKGGKWTDAEYVRNYLVYAYAHEAIKAKKPNAGDKSSDTEDEDEEEVPSVTPAEWKQFHSAAIAKVDAIPPEQRAAKAQEVEAERERRAKEAIARAVKDAEKSDSHSGIGGAASLFFQAMFGPIDILFFLLAIITAYRIGSHGLSVGQGS